MKLIAIPSLLLSVLCIYLLIMYIRARPERILETALIDCEYQFGAISRHLYELKDTIPGCEPVFYNKGYTSLTSNCTADFGNPIHYRNITVGIYANCSEVGAELFSAIILTEVPAIIFGFIAIISLRN
nr:hypothetical protein K-LCC10_0147 [Kaumoebavirus]